LSPISRVGALP
jgi:NAD(P)-dependent dehydrogenase (short-subunit alcohol dehydrogenase family)